MVRQSKEAKTYPDDVIVVPSNLRWQFAQQAVLVTLLKPQHPNFQKQNIEQSYQIILYKTLKSQYIQRVILRKKKLT